LRPNPARPTIPEPSNISVAGSGTGVGPLDIGSVLEVATVVEVKLDLLTELVGSSEGQPIIPKNIIKIHKNTNNFFTFPLIFYKNANIII